MNIELKRRYLHKQTCTLDFLSGSDDLGPDLRNLAAWSERLTVNEQNVLFLGLQAAREAVLSRIAEDERIVVRFFD